MKRFRHPVLETILCMGMTVLGIGAALADGRPGSVEWSDGRKIEGTLSLSPGKDFRLFLKDNQVALQLNEVKEIRFKPEKEEMHEGYYFPTAGQATQAKTGEVFPTRYITSEITLTDGKVLEGHLFTTMLYVETDTSTEKVLLLAKQVGDNGQKLADMPYPTDIRFDNASSAGASQIDLTQVNFKDVKQIVAATKPDLGLLPVSQMAGKQVWTVPMGDPQQFFFSVETADGIHVAWPDLNADPSIQQAVTDGLNNMHDFFDSRTLLGCFSDADASDVYSLVMLRRVGEMQGDNPDKKPWSVVILRWKYDSDEKNIILLGRVALANGRPEANVQPPAVLKEAGLLKDVSVLPTPTPEGNHP